MGQGSTGEKSARQPRVAAAARQSGATGLPPEEVMQAENGIAENDEYADMRWATATQFSACYVTEGLLLDLDLDADEVERFDEIIFRHSLEPPFFGAIDLGLRAAVVAVSLVGGVPYTSCSGQEGHCEQHPVIAFWAEKGSLALIKKVAKKARIAIAEGPGGMDYPAGYVLSAAQDDLLRFRSFASDLYYAWESSQKKQG